MPSLFDRAGVRCEQNILRRWPAWRQAHMKPDERPAFWAWKAANVQHLESLRKAIVAGGEPDIDRGWPDPRDPKWDALATAVEAAKEVPPPVVDLAPAVTLTASYTFDRDFLERERRTSDESLAAVDQRLLEEYESLEVARPLDGDREARRRLLFDNFYDFKG